MPRLELHGKTDWLTLLSRLKQKDWNDKQKGYNHF